MVTSAAKELHFNRSGETLKKMQAGVDKLATVVGVTLGPKVSTTTSLQSRPVHYAVRTAFLAAGIPHPAALLAAHWSGQQMPPLGPRVSKRCWTGIRFEWQTILLANTLARVISVLPVFPKSAAKPEWSQSAAAVCCLSSPPSASLKPQPLCPQGRNVVLEQKFGSPKIVNDGVTVAKEVELEDPVENIGAKLVRQVSMSLKHNRLVSWSLVSFLVSSDS